MIPTQPFTISHCLLNFDTQTHTVQLDPSSSHGCDRRYYLQPGVVSKAVVPLTGTEVMIVGDSRLGILAVYTATGTISEPPKEWHIITATSTINPAQLRDSAYTLVVAPGFSIQADASGTVMQYLPVAIKNDDLP